MRKGEDDREEDGEGPFAVRSWRHRVCGIHSVNNSSFEIYLAALFGVIGFVWMKLLAFIIATALILIVTAAPTVRKRRGDIIG